MVDPENCMEDTNGRARTFSLCAKSEVTGEPVLDSFLKKIITQSHGSCKERGVIVYD